ncbi:MAG: carboxyltransferase domain-containing protein [Flavobacteriaceae bacterium]|nr:carboxyltransferase domain-containing protein [Flavobacteriaceae bacterium]
MLLKVKFKEFGKKVYIINITKNIHANSIIAWQSELCNSIQNEFKNIIEDVVFSLSEITLFFKEIPDDNDKRLIRLWVRGFSLRKQTIKRNFWEIPACFDPIYSEDLMNYFQKNSLACNTYISDFLKCIFQVHHYGFLPGFFYSTGLPTKLNLPRKASPLKLVEPGTLAIGESYVGIYPQKSPGGWHRIGKTYYSFFNRLNNPPCFALPGDKIKFTSINLNEYQKQNDKIYDTKKLPNSTSFEIIC